jgi:hypothetical protein
MPGVDGVDGRKGIDTEISGDFELTGVDPFHGIRVQAELSGPWIEILRHLLGGSPAALRDLPVAISG